MKRSAVLVCLFALALSGCGIDDPYFDVEVEMINEGAPVQGDLCVVDPLLLTCGVSEDFVEVRMRNKARSDLVVTDTNSFLHDFVVTRYTVTWRRVDGGPSSGAGWNISDYNFEAGTSVVVPIGSFAEFTIMISPAGMKRNEPFATALTNGEEVLLVADIEFVGRRGITSDKEIRVRASLSANFANFEDAG